MALEIPRASQAPYSKSSQQAHDLVGEAGFPFLFKKDLRLEFMNEKYIRLGKFFKPS